MLETVSRGTANHLATIKKRCTLEKSSSSHYPSKQPWLFPPGRLRHIHRHHRRLSVPPCIPSACADSVLCRWRQSLPRMWRSVLSQRQSAHAFSTKQCRTNQTPGTANHCTLSTATCLTDPSTETIRRFPFRIEIVSMHRPARPGALLTVFTARDSESCLRKIDVSDKMLARCLGVPIQVNSLFCRYVEPIQISRLSFERNEFAIAGQRITPNCSILSHPTSTCGSTCARQLL